jgi:hypothetical protein
MIDGRGDARRHPERCEDAPRGLEEESAMTIDQRLGDIGEEEEEIELEPMPKETPVPEPVPEEIPA